MIRSPACDSCTHTHTRIGKRRQQQSGSTTYWTPGYLRVLPGGDEADLQLDLCLMLLVDLKRDEFTEFLH